jgi:hypothetical protein
VNRPSVLNADVPGGHFYCLVRREYLHNLEAHHGEFEEAAVFGVCSVPNRGLTFHVLLKSGAQFARVPLHALAWKSDAPPRPLHVLQTWDCFGYQFSAHRYAHLDQRECCAYLKHGERADGVYLFTVDWLENGYSDTPDQHKCAHVLKLDDGNFAALPNNRILWRDASFIEWPEGRPTYRTNTHIWYAEEEDGQIDANVMGGEAAA